jgi:hypothetical protein
MFNYLERITVAAVAIFLSSVILFPSSPLSSTYYSIVYAADVMSCGRFFLAVCYGTVGNDNMKSADKTSGPPTTDGAVIEGLAGNDVLTGGPGNDVLTGGLGADSFNCGPGDDIIKDFNKAEGDTTSKNCEHSEEPIDCNLIVKLIETLKAQRNVLQEKLQFASTNQEPDLVADLVGQIESLNAEISHKENQLHQCLQTNIDNTPKS